MRVRFAPSPTGQLHVGNARTALFNWLLARGHGGTFILRIEDTDRERSTQESSSAILEDLRWLGLDWDEGPDIGGPHGPYRQSERLDLYQAHANVLRSAGVAYSCFCTAAEREVERRAAIVEGRPTRCPCRRLSAAEARARAEAGAPAALRFRVPDDRDVVFQDLVRGDVRFHTSVISDPTILRADGTPAYNFAVVVDDALMEMTHVVRGEDHISNTPRQILMYEALGFTPPAFAHLALVLGPDHSPLSKRHGATSVAEFRATGFLPEALGNYLALIGWSPGGDEELLPMPELARRFSLDRVGHSAGVFDEGKLAWANRRYLKLADPLRIARLSVAYFRRADLAMSPDSQGLEFLASALAMATSSVDRLDQIPARLVTLFDFNPGQALTDPGLGEEMRSDASRRVVRALAGELQQASRLDRDRFRSVADKLKALTGQKGRPLFHPIRVALTGRAEGPELDLLIPAIDRGADLPVSAGIPTILGCRERASAFLRALETTYTRDDHLRPQSGA